MSQKLDVNIMVSLIKRIEEKRLDIGKIQLQKLMYFLKDFGVPLSYRYVIYHYGPYSFELTSNLDSLDSLDVLDVVSDEKGYGYHIKKGDFADKFFEKDDAVTNEYKDKIDFVIDTFASCEASEIELKATIHFVHNVLKNKKLNTAKKSVTTKVKQLKPRFTEEKIELSYDELNKVIPLI